MKKYQVAVIPENIKEPVDHERDTGRAETYVLSVQKKNRNKEKNESKNMTDISTYMYTHMYNMYIGHLAVPFAARR